jgi:hypothetical protein
MQIIKLSEAKKQGLKHYFTGVPCKRGHISLRNVANANCMECSREKQAERMKNPIEKAKQSSRSVVCYMNRRKNDPEFKAKDNAYRIKWTAEKKKDPEYRAKCNARAEELRKLNPVRHREKVARHKMAKLKRMPKWLSKENRQSIKAIYAMRDWLNMTMFGIKYEVDHIIPIRGEIVSGLHVPENLQIIKAMQNSIKGNSYEIA